MKIAVWHNLPSGGGKRALYYHIQGLLKGGHTIEAWSSTTADQKFLPLSSLIKENVLPLHWKSLSSQRRLENGISWVLFHGFHNFKEMDRHCRQCAEEINTGGFDLLLANASRFMAVAPIGKYVRIPRLLYLGEPTRSLYESRQKWPWLPPDRPEGFWKMPKYVIDYIQDAFRLKHFKTMAREEWHNIQAYNTVLANSLYSRESILKAYGINARVCYLGVDTGLFVDRHQKKDNFIVGVGSFTPFKNIEFVIKALAFVKHPRPRLVWIGNFSLPQYLNEMKELAKSLAVDFEAKEMVSDDDLIGILNRAAMMVYAPRLEPFGFPPLEANACGLPVVAVAEGGVRETVVDGINGLLVEPDEKAMASAIKRLWDDKNLAYTLGQNGRKLVAEKWSLEASIDRIERRLEEVLWKAK
jgi:glycosyltransferase involved in cell wall biosynthesis